MKFPKKLKLPQLNLSSWFGASRINFLLVSQFFFGLAIFLLPLRIRSLFYFGDSYSLGFFDEHLAFFFHASDLLLLLAFLMLGIAFLLKKVELIPPNPKFIWPFFVLLLFSAVVIPFAHDPLLALLHFWRVLEFSLVAFFIASGIFHRAAIIRILMAAIFLQAVLAIAQFTAHGELGFHFFGESFFIANTFNVAKVVLPSGEVLIRGMGTLAHANILGGIAAITLLILAGCSRKSVLTYFISAIILAGMFFSFSRAAYLAFFTGIALLLIFQFRRRIISSLIAFSIFGVLLLSFGTPFLVRIQSATGTPSRTIQISQALTIAQENPLGVGRGSFTLALAESHPELEFWQLQPTHNFFVLKAAEESALVAFAWLAIFVSLAVFAFQKKKYESLALLLTTFLLANFDHYFSTNFTAEAMLWLVFGLVVLDLGEKREIGLHKREISKKS